MQQAQTEFFELCAEWETDYIGFLRAIGTRNVYRGEPLTPQQRRAWDSVIENKRTAIKSGNGTGKDWLLARMALWYALTRGVKPPHEAITLTTSPQFHHLKKVLWGEIRTAFKDGAADIMGGTLLPSDCEWYCDRVAFPKWYMRGIVATVEGAFSGYRGAHVFIGVDEACDIDEHIWEAIEPMVSGPDHKLVTIGNPIKPTTGFYQQFRSATFEKVTLNSRETAGYGITDITGIATEGMIADIELEHGEGSGYVKAHVDGVFPESAEDKTFPLSWIEAAEQRDLETRYPDATDQESVRFRQLHRRTMGVDPSGGIGGDRAVILIRDEVGIVTIEQTVYTNPMSLCARIVELAREYNILGYDNEIIKTAGIVVDSVGNDVADRLAEFGITVDRFKGGSKARRSKKFFNRRAEGYWHLREAINPNFETQFSLKCEKQAQRQLREELDAQRHIEQSDRVIAMERKEEIKKRLRGKSPDIADALSMTFAPPRISQVW